MKEKLHTDIVRVGTKSVDHNDLSAIEATAMSIVAILSITLGTIYGSLMF
ncbi:MAG: hypothetical protein WCT32_01825 [Patescibacteria group bacterium]|jgi:hypothetical protein